MQVRSHGVMVSTLDFESSDPSSNLGGTFSYTCPFNSFFFLDLSKISLNLYLITGSKNNYLYAHFQA